MNILLVSPYRGVMFELAGIRMQPLGVSYIAAALKAAGHDVQIQLLEDASALPDFTGADVVGISCNTVQFNSGLKVARMAKERGKVVIMGGAHPTSCPTEALKSGYVDYVVRAEGEITVVELLDGIKNSGKNFNPGKVFGISWVDKESGKVVHNPARPFIQDLDRLPFPIRDADWRYGNDGRHHKSVDYPLITTRGCPYGCKFCDVHLVAGRRFRIRSIENVVREIEEVLTKYEPEKIIIVDDIINFNNERITELFNALIRRNIDAVRWVMGRGDHLIKNPETAGIMAEAGVQQMFLGIESPNERILKAYKKGGKASGETSVKAVRLLKEHGIETWGAFIIGEPSETMEDINRTISFAKMINPGTAQFTILTPYPGTALWHEVEPKLLTRNWDLFDAMHSVFKTEHIQPKDLEHAVLKAYRSFYTQPKRIIHEIFARERCGKPNLNVVFRILKGLRVVFPN